MTTRFHFSSLAGVLASLSMLVPPALGDVTMGIAGVYRMSEGKTDLIVRRIKDATYELTCADWEGVGMLEGNVYRGVFRHSATSPGAVGGEMGVHTIDWSVTDRPILFATYVSRTIPAVQQEWKRVSGVVTPVDPDRPAFGDYVYVEELPEAIVKMPPSYPDVARESGVEGTVVVQALVLKDGTVGDTRVVKSVFRLDEAASAAVRKYRFKPAMAKGKPVAVWVAIPIRFTLH